MTSQASASVVRQVAAVAVSIFGLIQANGDVLTGAPKWVGGLLTAAAPAMFLLEHWLSDPSTGNTVPTPTPVIPPTPPHPTTTVIGTPPPT